MNFKDKITIINQGTSDIGVAIADQIIEKNGKIVLVGNSALKLEAIKKQLNKKPINLDSNDKILTIKVKIYQESECQRVKNLTIEKFGKVDILINNFYFDINKNILQLNQRDWTCLFFENVISNLNMIKTVQNDFEAKADGKIIIIHESNTVLANKKSYHWFVIENSIIGIIKGLALELAKYNIKINCIISSFIETEKYLEVGNKLGIYFQEFRELSSALVALRRLGKPIEIANLVLFLASEDSDFLNGQVLYVKGGP